MFLHPNKNHCLQHIEINILIVFRFIGIENVIDIDIML